MCNLNIVIQTRKNIHSNIPSQIVGLLMGATTASYQHNCHGDGIYFSSNGTLITSLDKINVLEYSREIKNSQFIISHQRYATHGLTEEYTQPFADNGFVLVHNGVIASFVENKDESDSFGFFRKFNQTFNQENGTRRDRVVKSIRKLLNDAWGSYSIAIYDIVERKLYYFKNSSTSMHLFRSRDLYFLTTDSDNGDYLKFIKGVKFDKQKFEDYTIYCFSANSHKISIYKLGHLKKPVIVEEPTKITRYFSDSNGGFWKDESKSNSKKESKSGDTDEILSQALSQSDSQVVENCFFCQRKIKVGELYEEHGYHVICFDCSKNPTEVMD